MGIAVVSLIVLVVVALIAIPVLIRVFGEAASRNPNRPGGEGSDRSGEEDRNEGSGQGRE